MKKDVFFKDFFNKCEQIRRYLQVPLSLNVSIWFLKLYTHKTQFFSLPFSTCCEQKKREVGAVFHGRITKAEYNNPSSRSNFIYLFTIFFLLTWDLL